MTSWENFMSLNMYGKPEIGLLESTTKIFIDES